MATGAAGDGLRNFFESCISGADMGIQRRPYHRNCGCALHNKSTTDCPHRGKVSYPIRRSWSEGSLALIGQASQSPPSSPAAAAADIPRRSSQLSLALSAEDEGEVSASPSPKP